MRQEGFGGKRRPAVLGNPVIDPAGWHKEDISKNKEWIYEFNQSEIDELSAAIDKFVKNGAELMMLKRSDFGYKTSPRH